MKKILWCILFPGLILLSGHFIFKNIEHEGKQTKMTDNSKVIFTFLSAPGAGKGTLAQQCVDKSNFLVLSTGDLFRQHVADKTNIGQELNKYLEKGRLVPDEIVLKMVKEWLETRKDSGRPIILDGFPRTAVQAAKFSEMMRKSMKEHRFRIIKLEIPQEEIVQRLVNRRVCPNKKCGGTYNTSMPEIAGGKCPKCGAKLIQRKDDTPEVIAERFEVYKKHEQELVGFYESKGLEIEKLNVSQKTPEQTFKTFKKML